MQSNAIFPLDPTQTTLRADEGLIAVYVAAWQNGWGSELHVSGRQRIARNGPGNTWEGCRSPGGTLTARPFSLLKILRHETPDQTWAGNLQEPKCEKTRDPEDQYWRHDFFKNLFVKRACCCCIPQLPLVWKSWIKRLLLCSQLLSILLNSHTD